MFVKLTADPISIEDATCRLDLDGHGAVVTFSGHIRPHDARGNALSHMEYEAYEEMALRELDKLGQAIRQRWGVTQLAVLHRVGHVDVGEPSVVIAVAAGHRPEAFDACRFAIDELKRSVPLWKHEVLSLADARAK